MNGREIKGIEEKEKCGWIERGRKGRALKEREEVWLGKRGREGRRMEVGRREGKRGMTEGEKCI